MEFTELKREDYPSFLKIYNESFPPDERRIYRDEAHLEEFIKIKGGRFSAFAAKDGGVFAGFMSYWRFDGYIYVEHFAVSPQLRGKNIGSLMLRHLIDSVGGNVLIEVEHPVTADAARRIRFYERNGFRIRDEFRYLQPPYGPGQQPVELLLMTHGDVCLHDRSSVAELLREVYNYEEQTPGAEP